MGRRLWLRLISFKENRGSILSELLLAVGVSSLVLLGISEIYNFQTRFFDKILSFWQIAGDLTVTLASFKRYTTLGENVVSVGTNEIRIKIDENGGEKEVYWRVTPDGKLFLGIVGIGGGYGNETLLTSFLSPAQSKFDNWVDSETGIEWIGVWLTLRDKYGQEQKRISKYRLMLSGEGI